MLGDLRVKNSQLIDLGGAPLPQKISILLLSQSGDQSKSFQVAQQPVFSAINCYKQNGNLTSFVTPSDVQAGYTSQAAMKWVVTDATAPYLLFPLHSGATGWFQAWARVMSSTSPVELSISYGQQESELVQVSPSSWHWVKVLDFHCLSGQKADLKVLSSVNGILVDTISILPQGSPSPSGVVMPTVSPYVTVFCQYYLDSGGLPLTPISNNFFLTTKEDISSNGWYNFNMTTTSGQFLPSVNLIHIVVFASGSSVQNNVYWKFNNKSNQAFQAALLET